MDQPSSNLTSAGNGNRPRHNRWSQYDKWLRSAYIGDKVVTLTVKDITEEIGHIRGKSVSTLALHFEEVPNMLPLSPTNQITLASLFGNDMFNSIGNRIRMHRVEIPVGREKKHPIRILEELVPEPGEEGETQYAPVIEENLGEIEGETEAEEIE